MASGANPLPVTLLRHAVKHNTPIAFTAGTQQHNTPAASATHISLQKTLLPASTPSGYKEYSLKDVAYFASNMTLPHATYLRMCMEADVVPVSMMDRADLKMYLEGGESRVMKAAAEAAAVVQQSRKRGVIDDDPVMQRVLKRERTLKDYRSILCATNTLKNFSNVRAYASLLVPQTNKPGGSGGGAPSASFASAPSSGSRPASKSKSSKRVTPIIIVPAGSQSVISMFNVKDFLQDAKFVASETYRQQGVPKPAAVTITRSSSPKHAPLSYVAMDSVDTLLPADWDRVVAVFTVGQEWQFNRWLWKRPVEIFNHVRGFSVKFNDEPLNKNVAQWNVTLLDISRNRRHLDARIVYDFWQSIDEWIAAKKPTWLN